MQVLRTVLVQSFTRAVDEGGREVIGRREPGGDGIPPAHIKISSPYDAESLSSCLCKLILVLADVAGEAVGEVQGEGAEGLLPVLDDGAFDEPGGCLALVPGHAFLGGAGPGALVLDVADGQP